MKHSSPDLPKIAQNSPAGVSAVTTPPSTGKLHPDSLQRIAAVFTVGQIAKAIGMKRQAVQWHLRNTSPSRQVLVNGVLANAWTFAALPESIRADLTRLSQAGGYRTPQDMLSNPPRRYQPALPAAELHQDCWAYAAKLQRAQEYYLQNLGSTILTPAELLQHALDDYARAFGHTVTERHCRELLNRTIERDASEKNWADLTLYLPDRLRRKSAVAPANTSTDLALLVECVARVSNPSQLTSDEENLLWLRAFQIYAPLRNASNGKRAKREILDFFWTRVPGIARSENALRVSFDRKFKTWLEAERDPEAIKDGREKRLGQKMAEPYDPEQIRLIKFAAATRHEGHRVTAVRELDKLGLITDPRIREQLDTRSSKTYLRKSLHAELQDSEAFRAAALGPRAIEKMVPPRQMTYDGIHSMLCLVGDDLTSPVYVYVPDGNGWFTMTRCQLLCVADFRSLFITSFALNPSGQYNSLDVRTVYTTTFAKHGMPRFILREGGLWRNSRNANSLAAIGNGRSAEAPYSDAQVEFGLERAGVRIKSSIDDLCSDVGELGVQFREAFRARSKPIEKVYDILQALMAKEPGFCGRDEKVDCPEIVRKNLELVRTKKAHPRELGFYSFDEWVKRLEQIIAEYNSTPQEGRRLRNPVTGQGMSPREAFSVFRNNSDKLIRFDARCEMLLSHMRIPVEVKRPNLRRRQFPCGYVEVRGNLYCSEETGKRIGHKLLAHFNPHRPEFCTFTDMKLRDPFTVRRVESGNALLIDENTKEGMRQARSAVGVIKTEFRAMQADYSDLFGNPFRTNVVDTRTAELNQHVVQQAKASDDHKRESERRADDIRRKARNAGVPASMLSNDEETRRALENFQQAQRENAAARQTSETEAVE